MPNRVCRASGVLLETVKLGIRARRACVSSVVGITSIIREAFLAIRISRLSERRHSIHARAGAPQQPRLVSSAQTYLRGKSEAAHAATGGGAQRGHEELRPRIYRRPR